MQITPAIRARIAKLHQGGNSAAEISLKIGCSKSSVYRVLKDIDEWGECAPSPPVQNGGWITSLWKRMVRGVS